MVTLKGKKVYLRALEPDDLDFIFKIENDESLWELSHTQTPYSKFLIKEYLTNSHKDIYEAKQFRFVISDYAENPLGLIDLFDFDFKNKRVGIGILILNLKDRNIGIGTETLELVIKYVFSNFDMQQIYANVLESNSISLKLFKSKGFSIVGLKKNWNFCAKSSTFQSEYLLQLLNK